MTDKPARHPLWTSLRRAQRKVENAEAKLHAAKIERRDALNQIAEDPTLTDVQAGEIIGVKKQTIRDYRLYGLIR
jgi:hypothetical protein